MSTYWKDRWDANDPDCWHHLNSLSIQQHDIEVELWDLITDFTNKVSEQKFPEAAQLWHEHLRHHTPEITSLFPSLHYKIAKALMANGHPEKAMPHFQAFYSIAAHNHEVPDYMKETHGESSGPDRGIDPLDSPVKGKLTVSGMEFECDGKHEVECQDIANKRILENFGTTVDWKLDNFDIQNAGTTSAVGRRIYKGKDRAESNHTFTLELTEPNPNMTTDSGGISCKLELYDKEKDNARYWNFRVDSAWKAQSRANAILHDQTNVDLKDWDTKSVDNQRRLPTMESGPHKAKLTLTKSDEQPWTTGPPDGRCSIYEDR